MRTLDELDPALFERLVNALMLAESRGTNDHYVPFHSKRGITDRGFDGGTHIGQQRIVTLSVKHSGDGKNVRGVKKAVAEDMRRHRGRVWKVVTNVEIQVDDPIHEWLREKAPGSRVVGCHTVDLLLEEYPWLARHYGVPGIEGFDIFRPPESEAAAIPESHQGALAAMIEHLGDGRALVALVGTPGSGRKAVFDRLSAHLATSDLLPDHVRVEVHAGTEVRLAELGSAIREELRPSRHRYLLLVPPGPVANEVALRLRDLPGRGGHVIAVAVTPAQARDLPADATSVALKALSDEEMQHWLTSKRPRLRLDVSASVTAAAGGSPAVAEALVTSGGHRTLQAQAHTLEQELVTSLPRIPRSTVRGALGWLLLSASERSSPSFPIDRIAAELGTDGATVRAIIDAAVAGGLLAERHGNLVDVSMALSAHLLHVLNDQDPDRWVRRIANLAADEAWWPTIRLASLELTDRPLLAALDRSIEEVAGGDYYAVRKQLARAEQSASVCEGAADRALAIAQLAEARSRAPGAFGAEASDLGLPADSFPRHALAQVVGVLEAALRWPTLFGRAVPHLLQVAQQGTRVDLPRLGKSMVFPAPGQPSRPDLALDVVEHTLATGTSAELLELVRGVAGTLLAASVEVTGSYSTFVSWGHLSWEDHEDVHRRRDRLASILLGLTATGDDLARQVAWEGLQELWGRIGPVRTNAPREVHDLASKILSRAREVFDTPGAWEDSVWAEAAVLSMIHRELASGEERSQALAHFPRDPEYQLWRFLSAPDRLLLDPTAAAAQVDRPEGWGRIVRQYAPLNLDDAAVRALVDALLAKSTADRLVEILDRAQRYQDRQDRSWSASQPLHVLATAQPTLFDDLLSHHWDRLPSRKRRAVAYACHEALRTKLEHALWSGNPTEAGAYAALRRLREAPELATAADLDALLPTALSVSVPARKLVLLELLAASADVAARTHVAMALADQISFSSSTRDGDAVLRVARALIRMDEGSEECATAVLLRCVDRYPADRTPRGLEDVAWRDFQLLLGWFLIDRAVAGLPEPVLGESGRDPVVCAAQADPDRWLHALIAVIESEPARIPTASLLPRPLPADLTAAVVRHAILGDERWHATLIDIGGALTAREATPLIQEAVQVGRLEQAALLAGVTLSTPGPDALAVIELITSTADESVAKLLASGIAERSFTGRSWSQDGPAHLRALAESWRAVESDHAGVLLAARRISRRLLELAEHLDKEFGR